MAVFDLYSKRKKRQESQGQPDVYQYANIPPHLRIQIIKIWQDSIGTWRPAREFVTGSPSTSVWNFIHNTIAKENGEWHLGKTISDIDVRCFEHLMDARTDDALDIIELSFRMIDRIARKFAPGDRERAGIKQDPDDAIEELNARFRDHRVGYQYVEGEVIQVDSQFLHAEAVKPALVLLNAAGFSGPSDEFMRAFDHHRKRENKDAIADALSAFESTMKAICDVRGWKYGPKDTAKPLLDILFKNHLIPPELANHFAGLRSAMESGLPTLANRTSRHGQGSTPTEVPDHYVAYALHLLASNMVFLVECHKAKK